MKGRFEMKEIPHRQFLRDLYKLNDSEIFSASELQVILFRIIRGNYYFTSCEASFFLENFLNQNSFRQIEFDLKKYNVRKEIFLFNIKERLLIYRILFLEIFDIEIIYLVINTMI